MTTAVVFDMEDPDGPMPLGVYERTDEDVVIYRTSHAGFRAAPCDCVKVVDVEVSTPLEAATRAIRAETAALRRTTARLRGDAHPGYSVRA